MRLLGFYLGLHDSNLCAVKDGEVRYRKFERCSGIKHERVGLQAIVDTCAEWKFVPEYVAYSDGGRNGLGTCEVGELFCEHRTTLGLPSVRKAFCIDHHFAHILSAWPCIERGSAAIGIALDGRGDNNLRARVLRLGSGLTVESVFHSEGVGIGRFFTLVGQRLGLQGPDIDFAGKVMGAQAYGTPDLEFVERHIKEDIESLPHRLLGEITWRGDVPANTLHFFDIKNSSFLDWLSSCHLLLCQMLERFFLRFCSADDAIIYSGGCAQNTVFNRALWQRFPQLIIPPHAYDGGQSLGCVEFLRQYFGLPLLFMPRFPFAQDDEWIPPPSSTTVGKVASLLAGGAVVGWMVGHGEIGPRALGHRSILFDPRSHQAKEILNTRVKFREAWRPYAASVLNEKVDNWFDVGRASPYMLEATPVPLEKREVIPGVTHRDGTCRIQTVGMEDELASFRELLLNFNTFTGVPVLLNTSLNSAGDPIFGSVNQARTLLASGRLDALCVGDDLLIGG